MTDWIDDLLQRVQRTSERIRSLKEIDGERLGWKPNSKRWSVLECVDHLRVTGELYYPRLSALIPRLASSEESRHRPSFLGKMFLKFLQPDSRSVSAPAMFKPTTGGTSKEVIDQFLSQQEELEEILRHARGRELNRRKFSSPVSRWIRFTLGDGLAIMVTHQEKHWLQIERTLKSEAAAAG